MKKTVAVLSLFLTTGLVVVYASAPTSDVILQRIIDEIFNPIYKLVTGIAFVYFLYGAAKFIYDLSHPEEKNTGKQHLLWGTIGLFIMFSVGGILSLFGSIFGPLGG